MTDPYSYVAKPTSSTYSYSNPQGRQMYDQVDITYDDVRVFYDSVNESAYTSVSKPTGSVYTLVPKPV